MYVIRCILQASYEAGDHIGIVAENEDAVIARAAAALGHSLSLKFSLQSPSNNPHNLSPPFPGKIHNFTQYFGTPLCLRKSCCFCISVIK